MIHGQDGRTAFQPYGTEANQVNNSVSRGELNVALLKAAESSPNVRFSFGHRCQGIDLDSGEVSLLDTDTTNGLQMQIDSCPVAWTESGGPAYTYTCGGSTSVVLASRAVIGNSIALSNMSAVTGGNTDHLRVKLTLPAAAGNTLQTLSSTIGYVFTANQRTATSK